MNKKETLWSILKGLIWEILGITILYILTRDLKIGLIYVILRIILFPIFEVIWKKLEKVK